MRCHFGLWRSFQQYRPQAACWVTGSIFPFKALSRRSRYERFKRLLGTTRRIRPRITAVRSQMSPKDELEAMIAAQLLAAHNATMECYRRAMIAEQTFEGRRENLSQANKLSRTYAALVEALNRHRGKGQQKVTVEHVHVHAGGQAVVGVIGTSGGGDRGKLGEQPHEKQIGYAPEPALQSPDSDGEFVSIARDDQRALPDARGNLARRSEEE
jgi:hypothetical protein